MFFQKKKMWITQISFVFVFLGMSIKDSNAIFFTKKTYIIKSPTDLDAVLICSKGLRNSLKKIE